MMYRDPTIDTEMTILDSRSLAFRLMCQGKRSIRTSMQPKLPSHLRVCVYIKGEMCFLKIIPTVRVAGILDKNKVQKLQRSKIHKLSSLSDTIYPDKNSGPFPVSSAQHTDITWSTSTDDIPRTSQSTSKTGSHTHS